MRDGKHPAVHVRLDPELRDLVSKCVETLTERGKVPVSQSATIRRMLEIGAKEILRDRKAK